MKPDVGKAEQRVRQYWYDDGFTEIAVGILFLVVGVLFLLEALAPPGNLPRSFSAIGIVILVAFGMWITRWAVRWAKARITYPRTGYVRYRKPARSRRFVTLAVAIAVSILSNLAVSVLFATTRAFGDLLPATQGLFIGLFILYMGYQVGLLRMYILALFSFVAGSAISLAHLGDTLGMGVYFGAMGLAWVISGIATLALYLRNTRPVEGE